ncbi:MAG TPA: type IV secretion system DNA-binding domain-containing protein [Edaphobacter sp.]|nr:type IV secretion system DNA-binding domain-containing protein [Edaphobacter sp.]
MPANSPQQRAGVLGTLALAGDPLWMMPTVAEGRSEFCIRERTRDPKGWVFISSDSDTRDALRPLISMWMDLFILGLLASDTSKRTKLVYDEFHTLQTLTRLHDGITMLRSAGHQIIASIQNRSSSSTCMAIRRALSSARRTRNGFSPPATQTQPTFWSASAANGSC